MAVGPQMAQAGTHRRGQGLRSGPFQATFAVLWAGAHIIHVWHQGASEFLEHLREPWLLLVLAAAVVLVARPRSTHRLATLAALQLVAFAAQFPLVANHWTIAAFVNAGLLLDYARLLWRQRSSAAEPVVVLSIAGPHVRATFLIAYGAAAIAKLNTAFFDPAHSCAIVTLTSIAEWLPLPAPPSAGPGAMVVIWVVAGTELAVLVLLLVPRTRLAGVTLGALFHLAIAASPVVYVMDFTAFVLALLLLFLPADVGDALVEDRRAFERRRPALARLTVRLGRPLLWTVLAVVLTLAVAGNELLGGERWQFVEWGIFLSYGTVVTTVVVATALGRGRTSTERGPGQGRGLGIAHSLLILLLLLNAASPYLGGKTTSSFTMFSNLRTEAGSTNHYLLPRLPVTSPQDDLVAIRSSTDDGLQALADEGELVVHHELRRYLTAGPDVEIVYERDGEVHDLAHADDESAPEDLPWLQAKLLHFRTVSADGTPACQA